MSTQTQDLQDKKPYTMADLYKFLVVTSIAADKFEQMRESIVEGELKALRDNIEFTYNARYDAAVKKWMHNQKKQERACNKIAAEKTRLLRSESIRIRKVYKQFYDILRSIEEGYKKKDVTFLENGKKYLNKYIDENIKMI